MKSMKVDNQLEVTGKSLIPEGDYEAVISWAEYKKFQTGNRGIQMTLTIRSDINQPCGDKRLFDNLVKTQSVLWRFKMVQKAVGINEQWKIESLREFAELIENKPVKVKVEHKSNSGKMQARITKYSAGASLIGEGYEMYGDRVEKLLQQFRDYVRVRREKASHSKINTAN